MSNYNGQTYTNQYRVLVTKDDSDTVSTSGKTLEFGATATVFRQFPRGYNHTPEVEATIAQLAVNVFPIFHTMPQTTLYTNCATNQNPSTYRILTQQQQNGTHFTYPYCDHNGGCRLAERHSHNRRYCGQERHTPFTDDMTAGAGKVQTESVLEANRQWE